MFINLKIVALIAAIAIAAITTFASPSRADTDKVSCRNLPATACEAAIQALKKAPYRGPILPAKEPMACARVVSYQPTHVVWVAGTSSNYNKGAPVIASTSVVYTESFGLKESWTVTESCIKRRLLQNVRDLTLCNEVEEARGFHWSLTRKELGEMKRSGHFSSYVPFLRVHDRNSLSVAQVTAYYKARYHR